MPEITGYRGLSDREVTMINRIKDLENTVGEMVGETLEDYDNDLRWMAIARTDLQKGFMAWIRARVPARRVVAL